MFVVASIHGLLPLGGIVAQILAVAGPLGATGCFAAIVALRERAAEAVPEPVLDRSPASRTATGSWPSSTGCTARRLSTRRRS